MSSEKLFKTLGIKNQLLKALGDVGYEAPTPIQEETIPPLIEGRDMIGQAQTGTGKTAAFSLPMLQLVDPKETLIQGLVLVPTRELAIQVAEALHTYSKHLPKVGILPVYGGQPIATQLHRLRRGVQVVVGTPGRIMDHMRRGSLALDALKMLVLDEADEMLRMGFLEDVEWILSHTPEERQTALFTATMPPKIAKIAKKYLTDPATVSIARKVLTVPSVEQLYMNVSQRQKLDALTRILGAEPVEAAIVFTRTKVGAAELAEKLEARGIAAEPLHGDMSQTQREHLLRRFKRQMVDVVVATDVAARGLDVEHISHVVNYDIPMDVDSYVHRIGRTGRAGRSGVTLLFVTPRERRMMREIEKYTGKRMEPMKMPTRADVAARTAALFKESVFKALETEDMELYLALVEEMADESGHDMAEVAAALVKLAMGEKRIEVSVEPKNEEVPNPDEGMVRLFISAGTKAGIGPSDIVGAIANEADIPGKEIGAIDVYERFTFVEVPARYSDRVLARMTGTNIRGKEIKIKPAEPDKGERGKPKKEKKKNLRKDKKWKPRHKRGKKK